MIIHPDSMIIMTRNYGPHYSSDDTTSDISTYNRITTIPFNYPTSRELTYFIVSKSMNRKTMQIIGDQHTKQIIKGIPQVISEMSHTMDQWNKTGLPRTTKNLLLSLLPLTLRMIHTWIDDTRKGNASLQTLCKHTINQYPKDARIQQCFLLSLMIDAGIITDIDKKTKDILCVEPDLIKRLTSLESKSRDIDECITAYHTWYRELPSTYDSKHPVAIDAVSLIADSCHPELAEYHDQGRADFL